MKRNQHSVVINTIIIKTNVTKHIQYHTSLFKKTKFIEFKYAMLQTRIIQDKRSIPNHHHHPQSSMHSVTSHSSKKKHEYSRMEPDAVINLITSSRDIPTNSNDTLLQELDMHLPNVIAATQAEHPELYRDDQDIGFDFEESDQVITDFQDLPVQCDLSDDSSIDSFLLSQKLGREQKQKEEFEVIKGEEQDEEDEDEVSTCSTSESFSEDEDSVSYYPTERSSVLNTSCIKNHDMHSPLSSKTSSIVTKPTSILNRQKKDKIPKRSVSFSPRLVTEIHTTPRRSCQEWHRCYYTAHELQRMMDENDRNEIISFQPRTGQSCWGMQQDRQVFITAQEEEDDVLEI
jgi:hypothetical protein